VDRSNHGFFGAIFRCQEEQKEESCFMKLSIINVIDFVEHSCPFFWNEEEREVGADLDI
jgi:hypothetical protein